MSAARFRLVHARRFGFNDDASVDGELPHAVASPSRPLFSWTLFWGSICSGWWNIFVAQTKLLCLLHAAGGGGGTNVLQRGEVREGAQRIGSGDEAADGRGKCQHSIIVCNDARYT